MNLHVVRQPHTCHSNYRKVIALADYGIGTCAEARPKSPGSMLRSRLPISLLDQYGREFHHFCTTSYLGLDHHPALLEGAIAALRETGSLRDVELKEPLQTGDSGAVRNRAVGTVRRGLPEQPCRAALPAPESCHCWPAACSPRNRPPVMVFDRHGALLDESLESRPAPMKPGC
jgi:hypothetical protein